MTDSGNWPRVKDIFHGALERPVRNRAAYLQDACGEDIALRREVESLLAAHAEAQGFGEIPAIAVLNETTADAGVTTPAMTPGVELGPYRIVGPLDAGAMGEVYRARDSRLGRDVAVKVLPATLAVDADRIARLRREARLLAALNHSHIATIHSLEVSEGVCALVMELIEGPTLDQHVGGRALPVRRALDIARQIAEALEAAHAKGIVHRDLKPANIKLTSTGVVKVLDFGLAQTARPDDAEAGTDGAAGNGPAHESMIAGTPAYMSPEQARGEHVDQRADIWAFGCVLYELLTGRRVFDGTSVSDTLDAIQEREPDWQHLPPTVPAGIRRLLRRCLERDPNRRLHHMADARIEIEEVMHGEAHDVPVARPRFRHLRTLAGAAVLGAIALGLPLLRTAPDGPEMRVVDIATPWTFDPLSFALSPDGRRLAFVGDYQGRPTLWVRALDAEDGRPLPATQGARRPFWSPDGRSIGFFAFTDLKRIDAGGGTPQTVSSIQAGTAAAWGAAGDILFSGRLSRTISPSPRGLLRVNAAGGATGIATRPTPPSRHQYPQFLPDGRQFLFFTAGPRAVRGVYIGSLDSTESTRLVASDSQGVYVAPGWLLFVRQGALLAQRFDVSRRVVRGEVFTVADAVAWDPMTGGAAVSTSGAPVFAYRSAHGPVPQLAWFDRFGRAAGTLDSFEEGVSNVALSPDGRRVAVERPTPNGPALWLLDASHRMLLARATDETFARYPVWSARGDRIAFASVGHASVRVSARATTRTDDEALLIETPQDAVLSDWSHDDRFLLYFAPDPATGTDIWVLPQDTHVPRVFLATEANEMWGQFSPDGRWIAYQSNETGRFEIYVRPFPGPGAAVPISAAGGVYARWARDGSELYYVAPDATMMAAKIRRTAGTLSGGAPSALFRTRRVGGGVNVIGYGQQYDVAPDGRFLINVEPESNLRPITLVMNWKPPAR